MEETLLKGFERYETLLIVVSFLFWGSIIITFISGKIKYLSSVSLLSPASFSIFIGCLLVYFPKIVKERIKQGPDIPFFPIVIGVIIIIIAILCLFIDKISVRAPNRPLKFRWSWLIFAEIILIAGLILALLSIFKFRDLGFETPLPGLASLFWISFISLASFIFYRVSKMNSESRPNLMRFIVFLFAYVAPTYSLIISLILIYSTPTKISYVFWAAIVSLGFLPPSLVMLGIAKDHLPVRLLSPANPTPNINKSIEG